MRSFDKAMWAVMTILGAGGWISVVAFNVHFPQRVIDSVVFAALFWVARARYLLAKHGME